MQMFYTNQLKDKLKKKQDPPTLCVQETHIKYIRV